MNRSDPYLKTYAGSHEGTRLRTEIDGVWQDIRSQNLYCGQPRSAETGQAKARALASLKLASQTNDRGLLAEACRLMAHTLNADEEYEQSVDYYQKAISLFENSGSGEQAARTRLGYMAALYMIGQYDEASTVGAAAEQWFQAHDHAAGLAKVQANIGNLNSRRGQHQAALQHHLKACGIFERLADWNALAMIYLNIANCFSSLDQWPEAEKMYGRAEELSGRLNMNGLFMQVRYNASYLRFLQGRYIEALDALAVVHDYFSGARSWHHAHLCNLDLAEVYLHMGKPAEALAKAGLAIDGFDRKSTRYEHAKSLAFSALALAQLNNVEEARQAASASRGMFVAEDSYWASVMDLCLARLGSTAAEAIPSGLDEVLELTINKRR